MAEAKPTAAATWRKSAAPELTELPSGNKARLRKTVNVYAALRAKVLTVELLDAYFATQRGELRDPASAMALQDALICWLFVQPRCVRGEVKVPQGAIHIEDLGEEDLDFLIARAFGGAPEDGTFPGADGLPGDGRGAAPGADGAGVADDAEPDGGGGGGDAAGVPDRPPPRRAPGGARGRPAGGARRARAPK